MPDISEAHFPKGELALVYVAGDLSEATELLETRASGGLLQDVFQSKSYAGIGFYSLKREATRTREILRRKGHADGLIEEPQVQ